MGVYKRGRMYWFELVYDGQRYQRAARTSNRRAAEDIASAFRTALARGEAGLLERKKIPKLTEAMTAFLGWSKVEHGDHPNTTKRYVTSSKAILRHFRTAVALDKITAADVEDFKTTRSGQTGKRTRRKLRPATVNRELACLKAMFNHALKAGLLIKNPVDDVAFLDEDNLQDRILTFAEQDAYLAAGSQLLRDVATLILETGMRPGEVYALRDTSCDLEGNCVKVLKGKTPAAKRRIELTAEARRIVERRLEQVAEARIEAERVIPGYLFPLEGNLARHIPKVDTQHTAALRSSKVAKFRLYDLRHTWATRASEGGVDPVTLAAMLGHSKIHMVMRYVHPTQHHQISATQRIEAYAATARAKEKSRAAEAERKAGNVVRMRSSA